MERMTVQIHTEFIKLDALLKYAGVVQTGGQGKELIASGSVFLNDEVCTMRGNKICPGDLVRIDDRMIEVKREN